MSHASTPSLARPARNWRAAGMRLAFVAAAMVVAAPALALEPFTRINPCGFAGLETTQVSALGGPADVARVAGDLLPHLLERLGYNSRS